MAGVSSPPLPPEGQRRTLERAARTNQLRRQIAVGSTALLLVSWNAVAVLGTDGGATALASPTAGSTAGGSVDAVAPVTTRQS